MLVTWVLGASILLQFTAAYLALRLIRITGTQAAWVLIAMAVALMGVRRSITFIGLLRGDPLAKSPDLITELVALSISLLMVAGIAWIRPFFLSIQRSQQAIRDSETNLRALTENANDGILVAVNGKHVFANHKAAEILGYDQKDLLGLRIEDILHPLERDHVLDKYYQRITGMEIPGQYETVLRRSDGKSVAVEVTAAKTVWHGEPAGMILVRDITLRLAMQGELEESQRTLSTLMSNLPGMAYRCINQPDWPITFASAGALELTGFSPQDYSEGRVSYTDLIIPQDREHVWAQVQTAMQQKCPYQLSYRINTKDGEEKWIWEQGQGVYGDSGKLLAIEGFSLDITTQKQAEEKLRQYRDHLEELVDQRTEELAEVNKELEAFTYSVSHDLRAPLRSIAGFSEALEQDYGEMLDQQGRDYLGRVHRAVKRMDDLTNDLMKLSHMRVSELQRGTVDLSELAHQVATELQKSEPSRKARFKIDPKIQCRGDKRLLQLVLENLMSNAWKFTARREQALIEFGQDKLEGNPCYFVRDNGVGFDMTYAHKLFTPFQRLHSVEEFAGTGIGLATVQRIVNRHGGRIWVESAEDQGSTFYFTLG